MNWPVNLNLKSPYWQQYAPDIRIFLILIPLIAGFNYYLTYSNIRLNSFLLLTFTIDTLQGYLAWLVVRHIIIRLDRFMPYERQFLKRLFMQIALTTLSGLIVISATTEIVSLIFKGELAPLDFYTFDLFIIGVWFLVINGLYISIYFYNKTTPGKPKDVKPVSGTPALVTRVGNTEIVLPCRDIKCIFRQGDYAVAVTREDKQHLLDNSLNEIFELLPAETFYRLNRQTIMHRDFIKGYRIMPNRRLLVLLTDMELDTEQYISRTKAPEFKKWFSLPQGI